MQVLNSSRDGVLAAQHRVSSFVDTSEAGHASFRCRPVSVVCGGTPILRFSQTNSGVHSATQVVQQSEHRRGPTEIMRDFKFEPEAAGDRVVNRGALVMPRVVRAAVARSEGSDVEMKGSVGLDVYKGTR